MHRGRFSSSGLPVHFLAILINKKNPNIFYMLFSVICFSGYLFKCYCHLSSFQFLSVFHFLFEQKYETCITKNLIY